MDVPADLGTILEARPAIPRCLSLHSGPAIINISEEVVVSIHAVWQEPHLDNLLQNVKARHVKVE